MTRSGFGRGKLILFGEHAAVHGHPAVGMPLDSGIALEWEPEPRETAASRPSAAVLSPGIILPSPTAFPEEPGDRESFEGLLHALAEHNPSAAFPRGRWHVDGRVPRAGGFGSSAALCVALARIALDRKGGGYDRDVHRLANLLERRFHVTPSGIDTGMASDDGPSAWRKKEGDVPERIPLRFPELPILYAALPRSAPTGRTVGALSARLESGDGEVQRMMNGLGGIAEDFIGLCTGISGEESAEDAVFARVVGDLANRAQSLLATLGLSTPRLDEVLEIAGRLGAVGGKLSGAGMGGAFFLIAPDEDVRDELAGELPRRLADRGIVPSFPPTPLAWPER